MPGGWGGGEGLRRDAGPRHAAPVSSEGTARSVLTLPGCQRSPAGEGPGVRAGAADSLPEAAPAGGAPCSGAGAGARGGGGVPAWWWVRSVRGERCGREG